MDLAPGELDATKVAAVSRQPEISAPREVHVLEADPGEVEVAQDMRPRASRHPVDMAAASGCARCTNRPRRARAVRIPSPRRIVGTNMTLKGTRRARSAQARPQRDTGGTAHGIGISCLSCTRATSAGRPSRIRARCTASSTCPSCGKDLKICLNCRFYSPGAHWDCSETIDELVDGQGPGATSARSSPSADAPERQRARRRSGRKGSRQSGSSTSFSEMTPEPSRSSTPASAASRTLPTPGASSPASGTCTSRTGRTSPTARRRAQRSSQRDLGVTERLIAREHPRLVVVACNTMSVVALGGPARPFPAAVRRGRPGGQARRGPLPPAARRRARHPPDGGRGLPAPPDRASTPPGCAVVSLPAAGLVEFVEEELYRGSARRRRRTGCAGGGPFPRRAASTRWCSAAPISSTWRRSSVASCDERRHHARGFPRGVSRQVARLLADGFPARPQPTAGGAGCAVRHGRRSRGGALRLVCRAVRPAPGRRALTRHAGDRSRGSALRHQHDLHGPGRRHAVLQCRIKGKKLQGDRAQLQPHRSRGPRGGRPGRAEPRGRR